MILMNGTLKVRDAVIAATEVIISDDAGSLWEALKKYFKLGSYWLFGKCKLVSEKHILLNQARLSYVEKVQENNLPPPQYLNCRICLHMFIIVMPS